MLKYFIQVPEHRTPRFRNNHSSSPAKPRILSDEDREALVNRYFISLAEVMEKWDSRLKEMGLTRKDLPLICRKIDKQEEEILAMKEVLDWFYTKSGMSGNLWRVERTKADLFDVILDRVKDGIEAGEVFKVESDGQSSLPRKKAKFRQASRNTKPSEHIDFTPEMRFKLRDCFAQGDITLSEIHRYMISDKSVGADALALGTVYRWFNEKSGKQHIRKNLLAHFLDAAIALMEEKNGTPKHQTCPLNSQQVPHQAL